MDDVAETCELGGEVGDAGLCRDLAAAGIDAGDREAVVERVGDEPVGHRDDVLVRGEAGEHDDPAAAEREIGREIADLHRFLGARLIGRGEERRRNFSGVGGRSLPSSSCCLRLCGNGGGLAGRRFGRRLGGGCRGRSCRRGNGVEPGIGLGRGRRLAAATAASAACDAATISSTGRRLVGGSGTLVDRQRAAAPLPDVLGMRRQAGIRRRCPRARVTSALPDISSPKMMPPT